MKSARKNGMAEYITMGFYLGFICLPILVFGGLNIAEAFRCTFITFPTNYLLYFTPLALYFFLKKTAINESDKCKYLAAADASILVTMYLSIQTNRSGTFFTLIAFFVLSVICININEITAALILIPGLMLLKLGTAFIFAVYIPVLLLLAIRCFGNKKEKTAKKESSGLIFFAYLYICVLALILLVSGKLTFTFLHANSIYSDYASITKTVFSLILAVAACVLFIIRSVPVIRNGKMTEKIVLLLYAIYPLGLIAASYFTGLISSDQNNVILLTYLFFIMGNIQLDITYNEDISPLIPDKLNNITWGMTATVIFSFFCFD